MRYYVLSDDGQKFGPADVQTLNQWIAENRLLPTQMLEEEASGARFAARSVPGLNFPPPADATPPGGPYGAAPGAGPGQPQAGYYRPPGGTTYSAPGDDGSRDITPAWILFGVGIFSCCCIPWVGFLVPAAGVYFANRARQKGHPQGTTVFILNLIILVIALLLTVSRPFMGAWAEDMIRQSQNQTGRSPMPGTPPPSAP
ncbi:MAG: hypothetical protein ACO1SV_25080 [Fimbriimonas sp.]